MLILTNAYADIPEIENATVIVNDGEIYDTTTKGYIETGSWSDSGGGVDNRTVRTCGDSNAKTFWRINPVVGYYDFIRLGEKKSS